MNQTKGDTVSSFFYYMWNSWCEEECRMVFGNDYKHNWDKWCKYSDKTAHGAAENFYSALSDQNRDLLANRACELYDGAQLKDQQTQDVYYCEECGSTKVQIQVWVDPNNDNQFISDQEDYGNSWCDECDTYVKVFPYHEFMDDIVDFWWEQCDGEDREVVSGLDENNFVSEQEYNDACNSIWNGKTDEEKIAIWHQITHREENE